VCVCVCVIVESVEGKKMRWFAVVVEEEDEGWLWLVVARWWLLQHVVEWCIG